MADELLAFIQAGGITLRRYQEQVARALVAAVLEKRGLSFAVMFPRQSGKNELQAQIEAYLLWKLRDEDAELVKVSPTWRPQAMNAMRRLMRVLSRNPHTQNDWQKESGFILRVGRARISFLSGAPGANIVGATASSLLEVDEAQDVDTGKFDRDVLPMAASTNATRVFWGTAWKVGTLLSRELRAAQDRELRSPVLTGNQPVRLTYRLDADDVAAEVPAYRAFVDELVARFGRDHPVIRTQYYSEELDGEAGMFLPDVVALMQGSHSPQEGPTPGKIYALLLDVAGEDEALKMPGAEQLALWNMQMDMLANPRRDSTALTVVEVDLSTRSDPLVHRPTYRVVSRRLWTGMLHTSLYGEIAELMRHWRGQHLVVDATGVGAGLASFLESAFPGKVTKFIFTTQSKSNLGWGFQTLAKSGRWKEPLYQAGTGVHSTGGSGTAGGQDPWRAQVQCQQLFFQQLRHCQILSIRPNDMCIRWGVPDGTRDTQTGERVHDDLVISAALCLALEKVEWVAPTRCETFIVPAGDPIDAMTTF